MGKRQAFTEGMFLRKRKCRWLGIDFGERRIGLAITDELLIMAKPYKVIDAKKENPVLAIKKIVEENNVCLIVMGNPLHLSGKESELSKKVKEFKSMLESVLKDIKIVLYDERLTSKMAERMLANRGMDLRKSKEQIDLYAATFLLEEYLERSRE